MYKTIGAYTKGTDLFFIIKKFKTLVRQYL